jgi:hypothetical protein
MAKTLVAFVIIIYQFHVSNMPIEGKGKREERWEKGHVAK